ncbi:unnamed protein product [Rotaria sp. Silwood2]|nr:unnamed protein product [Rotaria sp. Silwood2]CAF4456155.1 unnamed protein product [Rotaria sp. Silwood2]
MSVRNARKCGNDVDRYLNVTLFILTSSNKATTFSRLLRVKFENTRKTDYWSVPDNTMSISIAGILNTINDDCNQTLTYTTNNPIFTSIDNRLPLITQLSYNK